MHARLVLRGVASGDGCDGAAREGAARLSAGQWSVGAARTAAEPAGSDACFTQRESPGKGCAGWWCSSVVAVATAVCGSDCSSRDEPVVGGMDGVGSNGT